MTKAKIVTFDSRAELKSWFDLRGEEDRAIIFSHRENLPNNMVKYESIVVTRQGTQRIAEKATSVVRRFLERYTGTLGITTKLADGVRQVMGTEIVATNATGTILAPKEPSFASKIIAHLKEYGRAKDTASINKAIGGSNLGSIYSKLVNDGKIVRLSRGYYIHPDYHNQPPPAKPVEPIVEDKPSWSSGVSTPNGANSLPSAHRLVIPAPSPVVHKSTVALSDEERATEMLEWLGSMAVKRQSPELFKITLELKGILNGKPAEVVPPPPPAIPVPSPQAVLTKAPEAILTERQLDFGAYLEDKIGRDVTPQELVENVLKKDYNPGQRHRFIYDTDMHPHGWYRTREDDSNVWRHESRRRVRRAIAGKTRVQSERSTPPSQGSL